MPLTSAVKQADMIVGSSADKVIFHPLVFDNVVHS